MKVTYKDLGFYSLRLVQGYCQIVSMSTSCIVLQLLQQCLCPSLDMPLSKGIMFRNTLQLTQQDFFYTVQLASYRCMYHKYCFHYMVRTTKFAVQIIILSTACMFRIICVRIYGMAIHTIIQSVIQCRFATCACHTWTAIGLSQKFLIGEAGLKMDHETHQIPSLSYYCDSSSRMTALLGYCNLA